MEPEKKEVDTTPDGRVAQMAATIGRMQIEALAQSAGAVDPKAVAEIVSKNTKADIDATGTVKITMLNAETGEKLRTASGEDMSPGQFVAQMKADPDRGHLFTDGAAKPSAKGTGGLATETNPWHRDTIHLGEQARLLKSDPGYAARLQAAVRGTLASNPFSKEGFNLTEQSRLLRYDPAQAERMRAEVQPKENPWLKSQINLTKQVLMIRSDPEKARKLKAEALLANGPAPKKSYIFTPPPNAFRRRA